MTFEDTNQQHPEKKDQEISKFGFQSIASEAPKDEYSPFRLADGTKP